MNQNLPELYPGTALSVRDQAAIHQKLRQMAADHSGLRQAYADAAREINCTGPVAERIRVLKTHHGQQIERMEQRLDVLESAARLVCEAWGVPSQNWIRGDMEFAVKELRALLPEDPEDERIDG